MLEMLRETLTSFGYRCFATADPQEALKYLGEGNCRIALCDLKMPTMDGLEMIQQMRGTERFHDTPAIALSGYASQKDSKEAIAAGLNAHVAKPVEPKELTALIDRLLRQAAKTKHQ